MRRCSVCTCTCCCFSVIRARPDALDVAECIARRSSIARYNINRALPPDITRYPFRLALSLQFHAAIPALHAPWLQPGPFSADDRRKSSLPAVSASLAFARESAICKRPLPLLRERGGRTSGGFDASAEMKSLGPRGDFPASGSFSGSIIPLARSLARSAEARFGRKRRSRNSRAPRYSRSLAENRATAGDTYILRIAIRAAPNASRPLVLGEQFTCTCTRVLEKKIIKRTYRAVSLLDVSRDARCTPWEFNRKPIKVTWTCLLRRQVRAVV